MEKSLTVYTQEQVELIKNTVAKGATNAELQMFVEICKSTKLNPFKKEIWFIKTDKGVQMMTGINGFLTIANNHPQFDGMEVSLEEKDGKLISATAKVYRKDRRFPSVATVYLQEYFKPSKYGNGMWEKMPRVMLQKVAKSVALREAFPQELNGFFTQEEMPQEFAAPQVVVEVPVKKTIEEKLEATPAVEEEPAKEVEYYYNLALLPNDKQGLAVAYASQHNIPMEYVDMDIFVTSTKPIPRFKNCRVDNKTPRDGDKIIEELFG